jgi:hypothetical protein
MTDAKRLVPVRDSQLSVYTSPEVTITSDAVSFYLTKYPRSKNWVINTNRTEGYKDYELRILIDMMQQALEISDEASA